jgi:TM2 domain-containing membrane protein YozV
MMTQQIQIACPHCDRQLRVPGETTGKQVRCPQCQFILTVPGEATEPEKPVEQHVQPTVEQRWSLRTADGQVYGPVSRNELDLWMREGRINESCELMNEATGRWIHAGDVYYHFSRPARPMPVQSVADSRYGYQVSNKSRLAAVMLGAILPFFGLCGVHRIYTGHVLIGILQLVTYGGCLIWQIIDVILLLAGSPEDANGLPLSD